LKKWLLTRFKNGFPVTTDIEFDPKTPWKYYKSMPTQPRQQIDPTKLMTLKKRVDDN
ncbi:MAG TPA: NADH-dependent flavin oxidoreductase, partial [Leuconostoc mesenteroides]|nr:NADH-dependent flavin oxidoreductase [Leuconostoc mesenteroides]